MNLVNFLMVKVPVDLIVVEGIEDDLAAKNFILKQKILGMTGSFRLITYDVDFDCFPSFSNVYM
uniref:Uncharacterized protein LOC103342860 n=1 Tax=Rhizophora mucronata TaxID=61149 RepID=A0A2P2J8T8_RHIMU